MKQAQEPDDEINIHDKRGYAYIPVPVQRELDMEDKTGKVPVLHHTGVAVLYKEGKTAKDIVNALVALIADKLLEEGQGISVDDWSRP